MNVTLLTTQTQYCKHVSIEAVLSPKTGMELIKVSIYNRLKDFFSLLFFLDQHNLQDLRISYLVHLLWYRNRRVAFFAQKHKECSNSVF